MYASFFGLNELPFNNTPDPRFFFSTPDHEEALASLIYAIGEGKGFVLLTGEVGAGKTLVTRLMLRHFGESIEFACINNTQVNANELLQSVCSEFKIDVEPETTNAGMIHALQDHLLTCFAANKPVVLMLDEAQALSQQAFEQVRMIGNLEADDAKLLQIVIVGQPELQQRFESHDMRQLRQRIFRSFHLSALSRELTEGYIRHRLSVAGAQYPSQILANDAIDVIYRYSQGLPRLINTTCDNALLSAYGADIKTVDASYVNHVLQQMMSIPRNKGTHSSTAVFNSASTGMPEGLPTTTAKYGRRKSDPHEPCYTQYQGNAGSNIAAQYPAPNYGSPVTPPSSLAMHHANENMERTLQRTFQVEADLRSLLEQAKAIESRMEPNLEQQRRLTVLVRRLLGETKAATEEVRNVIAEAETAKTSTKQAITKLAEQSARTGRLSVALREVFDKLEQRADKIINQSRKPGSSTKSKTKVKQRLLDKTKEIDKAISQNKNVVDEVRTLITATKASQPRFETEQEAIAGDSGDSPATQLADQVKNLARLIDKARTSQMPKVS